MEHTTAPAATPAADASATPLTEVLRLAANSADPLEVITAWSDRHGAALGSEDAERLALVRRIAAAHDRYLTVTLADIAGLRRDADPEPVFDSRPADRTVRQLERQLRQMQGSLSWRITAPLRRVRSLF